MTARSSLTGLAALILTFAGLERAAAADPFETVFATQPSGKACFAAITTGRASRRIPARK